MLLPDTAGAVGAVQHGLSAWRHATTEVLEGRESRQAPYRRGGYSLRVLVVEVASLSNLIIGLLKLLI